MSRGARRVRTVFLGSPPFATPVFARLADSPHAILALVTLPDRPRGRGRTVRESPLVAAARARGIEVIQAADPARGRRSGAPRALAPDVLLVASYGVLLKRRVARARAPRLPQRARLAACRATAALRRCRPRSSPETTRAASAIQRLVRELDAGDVLLERRRPIGPRETGGELLAALAVLGGEALVEALDLLAAGRATWTPQDHSAATRCRKLTKELGRIDWGRPAAELERFVRALTPWPGARALDPEGREITVSRAELVPGAARGARGDRRVRPALRRLGRRRLARPRASHAGRPARDGRQRVPARRAPGRRPVHASLAGRGSRPGTPRGLTGKPITYTL